MNRKELLRLSDMILNHQMRIIPKLGQCIHLLDKELIKRKNWNKPKNNGK